MQIKLVDTQGNTVASREAVTVGPGKSTSLNFFPPGPDPNRNPPGRHRRSNRIVRCLAPSSLPRWWIRRAGRCGCFCRPVPSAGRRRPAFFGLIDLAQGQVARFIAVNLYPSGPIRIKFQVFDASGMMLSEAKTIAIAPGASATFDVTQGMLPPSPIRAEFSLVMPDSPAIRFLATAEVFDPVSGTTMVAFPPSPVMPSAED